MWEAIVCGRLERLQWGRLYTAADFKSPAQAEACPTRLLATILAVELRRATS